MILRYYTRGDFVLILVLLVIAGLSFAGTHPLMNGGKHLAVDVDGVRKLELSLDSDTVTTVEGPLGATTVVVENGHAHIGNSPCPHKYCMRMGPISHRGEVAVCVPNRVVLSIVGGNDPDAVDGVTQ